MESPIQGRLHIMITFSKTITPHLTGLSTLWSSLTVTIMESRISPLDIQGMRRSNRDKKNTHILNFRAIYGQFGELFFWYLCFSVCSLVSGQSAGNWCIIWTHSRCPAGRLWCRVCSAMHTVHIASYCKLDQVWYCLTLSGTGSV